MVTCEKPRPSTRAVIKDKLADPTDPQPLPILQPIYSNTGCSTAALPRTFTPVLLLQDPHGEKPGLGSKPKNMASRTRLSVHLATRSCRYRSVQSLWKEIEVSTAKPDTRQCRRTLHPLALPRQRRFSMHCFYKRSQQQASAGPLSSVQTPPCKNPLCCSGTDEALGFFSKLPGSPNAVLASLLAFLLAFIPRRRNGHVS